MTLRQMAAKSIFGMMTFFENVPVESFNALGKSIQDDFSGFSFDSSEKLPDHEIASICPDNVLNSIYSTLY
jgi:hypothetical protein